MADRYISIPVEVEALQFKFAGLSDLIGFTGSSDFQVAKKGDVYNCLIAINGLKLLVIEGDYVVKKADGGIEIMTAADFAKKYVRKV